MRQDVIGEAAGVGEMLADIATSIVHQQAIEDVWRFARRCRNHLGCERRILIRDMTIGFQARGIAIFRVDHVHGLTLLCSDEELSVARSRRAHAQNRAMGNAACASTTMASARS